MKLKSINTKLITCVLSIIMCICSLFSTPITVNAASASVWYTLHVQDIGWMTSVNDGSTCGTEGRSLRAEAIQMDLGLNGISGGITYRTHIQDIGWTSWVTNRMTSGTTGRALRMEALQAKLTGGVANSYDLYYRAHVQDIGWMNWVKNGETAGTTNRSLRLEAIQVKLVPKGSGNADRALNWCNSKVGRTVGNGQCVALIKEYYTFLGVSPVSGNAKDYTTNSLPQNWTRVKGGTPQPGDILVYTGAKYGHVAIYAGGTVSYHQNMNGQYVEKKTDWPYNNSWYSKSEKGTKSYWGYIRPCF